MAVCDFCEREMKTASSCLRHEIVIEQDSEPYETHEALPWGNETHWPTPGESTDADNRCHDCAVEPGGYHHPGCDIAEDPRDHRQLLMAEFDYFRSLPE